MQLNSERQASGFAGARSEHSMRAFVFETFYLNIVHNHPDQFVQRFLAQSQRDFSRHAPQWHATQPRPGVGLRLMIMCKWKKQ
jgi:hypothetical protein